MGIRQLGKKPLFWVSICLMVCAGASELAMAQWASAYAEAALGLTKALGDLMGPCMFAFLAMAGDLGGSIGPAIIGRVTQFAGDNLRAGMEIGLVFPVLLIILLMILSKQYSGKK